MREQSEFSARLWRNIQDRRTNPFWIDRKATRTYGDLEAEVRKITRLLIGNDVSVSDVAVIVSPDDWKSFSFWVACVLNGVAPVVLAPDSGTDRIAAICSMVSPKVTVVSAARARESWVMAAETVCVDDSFGDGADDAGTPCCLKPADDTACIVFTSGTTNAPKGVVITHKNLEAQLQTITRIFQIQPGSRIYNGLVLYHVDGLFQGPLLALWSSAALLRPPQFAPQRIAADMDWLTACNATHMITAPAFLDLMDRMCPKDDYFRRDCFVAIISSSAKLPRDLWDRIETRFGVTVVNEYGMTETVAASHFAGALPEMGARFGIGKPVDCEARLITRDGVAPKTGQTGELQMRGRNVFNGYFGDPDLTATALQDGWLCTGDLARRNEAGDYEIIGRLSTAINFGGFLILPEEIDEAICRHPNVSASKTVGIDDAAFGQVPFSVYVSDTDVNPKQLLDFCRTHLESRKVPKRFFQVKKLPTTGSGKPDTAAVKNMVLTRFSKRRRATTDHLDKILEIASDVFGVSKDTLSPASAQEGTAGWDSYAHTVLMLETEEAFDIEIAASDMMAIGSLSDLAAAVARSLETTEDVGASRIQSVRDGDGQGSLVIMPDIAGRSAYAGRLLSHLTQRASIFTMSIDPRAAETGAGKTIHAMARDYADEIEAIDPPRPVTLLGISFGGFLAYETGVELTRRGTPVKSAVLLDTAVPWTHRRFRHIYQMARRVRKLRVQVASLFVTKTAEVPDATFEIESFGKVMLSEFPERQHATVKQSFVAMSTYKPSRSTVPVLVFSATNREKARIPTEPHLGWGRFSSGHVSSIKLGDSHTSILRKDDESKIAAERVNALLVCDI